MELAQEALKSKRPSRYSEWHKDKKSMKDEIDAFLARGLETETKETNNGLNKREKQTKDEIDSLKLTLVRAKNEFDRQLKAAKGVQGGLETEKKEIKQRLTEREKEVKSLNARLRLDQAKTQKVKNELTKEHQKKVEKIKQEKYEVIASLKNVNRELSDSNLQFKEKEDKEQDVIGYFESVKKQMDKKFTAKDKEVKSLNARFLLQQAETQRVKTELMKAWKKKVVEIIWEKDQILASVKTENTVLADRNLELMAKLKAVQTHILESITYMRMKITALKDSLRTEETEKEASFNQIKELESHTMDTEEKCLESKGDRKEEGDEIEEGTGK